MGDNRWWCYQCRKWLVSSEMMIEHHAQGHMVSYLVSAESLSAYRLEVIEECKQECDGQRLLATSFGPLYRAGWEAAREAITAQISALATRKEG